MAKKGKKNTQGYDPRQKPGAGSSKDMAEERLKTEKGKERKRARRQGSSKPQPARRRTSDDGIRLGSQKSFKTRRPTTVKGQGTIARDEILVLQQECKIDGKRGFEVHVIGGGDFEMTRREIMYGISEHVRSKKESTVVERALSGVDLAAYKAQLEQEAEERRMPTLDEIGSKHELVEPLTRRGKVVYNADTKFVVTDVNQVGKAGQKRTIVSFKIPNTGIEDKFPMDLLESISTPVESAKAVA